MSRTANSITRKRIPAYSAALLAAALFPALVGACGSGTVTPSGPTSTGSGLVSMEPPATGSPAASGSEIATAPATASANPNPPTITLKKLATGFAKPIGAATAPGDPRLFVIEQTGQIVIFEDGKVVGTFLNLAKRISCCSERGLLGLAFHPQYATNGRFFVRYTNTAGNLQISEFHVSADPNVADPASEKRLLTILHPDFANHNGGRIEFGPDGYLYIGTGDGGSGGDPHNHGQDLGVLLGKMLRIDVDHQSNELAYSIPATNPFVGQSGDRPEIFAYGLRNPYTFSFDRTTGDLWIADVGQDRYEEVDRALASAGGGSGLNYGWNVMEATHCYSPSSDCVRSGLTLPLAEYAHGAGDSTGCAIIGGYVYRGSAHADLAGFYLFADYCSGRIWEVQAAGPATQTPVQILSSGLRITGWGQDSAGELYITAENGALYQVV